MLKKNNPFIKPTLQENVKYYSEQIAVNFIVGVFTAFAIIVFTNGKIIFATIRSSKYWETIFDNISMLLNSFLNIFFISWEYFVTTTFLVLSILLLVSLVLKFNHKTYKNKYNPKEHTHFYVTKILENRGQIYTNSDFTAFYKDFIEDLYSLFRYKSIHNSAAWLKPEDNRLKLFATNSVSLYSRDNHFSFKSGEGVAGTCWKTGSLQLYSNEQPNDEWKDRDGCIDKSYICCAVPEGSPESKYGVISVGFRTNIYIEPVNIETMKLMATAFNCVLEGIPDDIKAQCGL